MDYIRARSTYQHIIERRGINKRNKSSYYPACMVITAYEGKQLYNLCEHRPFSPIKTYLKLDAKVNNLNPGNKYREVHNKITDTMLSAKSGFITIRNGLNINDESLVNEGKDAEDKIEISLYNKST
ncbi:hypothetical protein [Bacillus sp. S10(2024)]|uniref:hypothetical protein n=1 Tax=Bacillus sp. S10(2024) TaxID=3162886 RepID=UPI003D221C2B